MDPSIVAAIYRNEIRHLLRDRRTVVMSIVLPLVIMPLMLFGSRWVEQRRQAKLERAVFEVAVAGSQPDVVRELLAAAEGAARARGEAFRFHETAVADADKALADKTVTLVLRGLTAAEARQAAAPDGGKPRGAKAGDTGSRDAERTREEPFLDGVPVVEIAFRGDRDDSERAYRTLRAALHDLRRERRRALLVAAGFPGDPAQVVAVTSVNVASVGQVAGLTLGRLVTALLVLFMLSGGAVVATDALAGEKERGTLETLLTTGASREAIVAAKLLAIFSVALLIAVIQVGNLLAYVGFKLIPVPAGFAAAVPPPVAVLLLFLYLPLTALVAGVLLLLSGHARSYKEAQLHFFPVFLLGMVPTLAPLLPGIRLRSAIVLVPIANVAVAAKELLVGTFDWPMLAVAWLANAGAAAGVAVLATRALSSERLIVPSAGEGQPLPGPLAFQQKVLRNFAVMWGVLLAVGAATGNSDVRLQIAINLGVIFLGGTLLMVRAYHLDPRHVFALRPVKPVVWLAVLLGAPAGLLTGVGVFQLANLVVPVPPEILQAFGEVLAPADMPFWQVVVFLCVMPGIIEELTFRGALLHGLRRRFHPAVLALVVGLVFGLFHTSLFRIAPTAFLGVLLSVVTLLSGSIFPAMLWHALNNLLALAAARAGVPLESLDSPLLAAAAGILLAVFWILWRSRSVYPDLRGALRLRSGAPGPA